MTPLEELSPLSQKKDPDFPLECPPSISVAHVLYFIVYINQSFTYLRFSVYLSRLLLVFYETAILTKFGKLIGKHC